jgi:hypothetical protein
MKCGKNILPRVRGDWRPRWSAVLPGPRRSAAIGPWQPEGKPETGRKTDPSLRYEGEGNAQKNFKFYEYEIDWKL